jgi:ATP/maltotriose-dependent transcriptional regulator MalT
MISWLNRYHHLFRDMLLAELERLQPDLLPVLRRRAAAWCLDHDRPEEALEYAIAAGDVDMLVGEARALQAQLSADHGRSTPGASSLTGPELRVLPMLATYLSFPEIGAELFLSPHTVKSQVMSIYRKLGASSRSQAVARSREVGLLDR